MNLLDSLYSMHSKEILRKKSKASIKDPLPIEHLIHSQLYHEAEYILAYMPLSYEVDISPLLEQVITDQKKLYLPKVVTQTTMIFLAVNDLKKDLQLGSYGIKEPIADLIPWRPSHKQSLILAPALATTTSGYRLGHGGGFYDRFLSSIKNNLPVTIAVTDHSFSSCSFPIESHDIPFSYILTQKNLIHATF
ncbi:5-formyltetrahydrofolate cyclo-ligase [Entomospira nematocerorum]|uniref:5-formyltetrahydrofolate cyclo-ligase n=1 Tax=Entomospira nematocerorum TaxID=2719987 RepID=A0A968KTV3_9SPIO|nr:5-formyltetrahydrofolate cyclo-ligase [Entomospira nematocera]NIZ46594.1 5-formyltetrahydrofolate cyclo-ligase [Entomospira nematocera]WDI33608.1 5-formyltetrahydrofolate cyclo-ligase [Entomospira nematocera]